ncbi:FHA domain-containing protein [Variovorax boronicumulans]|uniref:type VI secretion system-associated FHA domain protein TagH n=1 Tax=Variovorax boronicumulans TaxID=436515 RepID=UPI00277E47A7|nr:type VI secretion system-associated FHA domain protein TagH [Variovorax boronicumulans]MDP9994085.1 FHA domain-containing protein [Variovorax boronicumulans]MDQ0007313.1 FHA domain-containing protein [Variovorax boronicumulans]
MIHIAVITRQGAPAGQPIAADFGPNGGTIGRADTNTLVLDDPDRTVSRVHAQVLCRDGQYFVIDRGSNPMQCNGVSLGSGKEAALTDGARLVVGSFELSVKMTAAAAPPSLAIPNTIMSAPAAASAGGGGDDPFADLLAGLGSPPASAPVSSSAAKAAAPASADSLLFPDPMATGSRNAQAAQVDPFANLLGPTPSSAPAAGLGALDDFSDLGAPPAHGKASGIDDLFGGMNSGGGIGGDPLALSPLADPLLQPNTASSADPLAALQSAAPSTPTPRSDHLPIDQFGFTPPKAVTPPPPPPPPPPPAPAPVAAAPVEALPQFDDITGQPIRISGPEAGSRPLEPLPPLPSPPPPPPVQRAPAPAASRAERTASDDELLAAFLRGLASTHQPPEMLTPGLMERIGSMLRSATEGTLQLLLTRQEFKREVRAEVTMIAAQANNPLKFSPTVEVALAHLLGPGVRGFMPPEAAMRDAFNDLRAHQFGVMVGMRAALAHVITRFEPEELEKKISAKSALDAIFAANRKAKLWDQFVALYGGIASEAEDDFHNLFGKAFLEAYEEQMARLKSDGQ